ncbi:MAG: hypothetical protein HY985_10975 [Magnetospirillum sp.]|nr:hypothetical protein [Magnetospirillum sp.]
MYYEDSLEPTPTGATAKPEGLPDKFWDPETQTVRTDALVRGYLRLERRLHRMVAVPGPDSPADEVAQFRRALGIPDRPEHYPLTLRHPHIGVDPEVNHRLHCAGCTPDQVQLIYDLAVEKLAPVAEQIRRDYQQQRGLDRLREHFGGDARWAETARQVAAWGKANLDPEVFHALASVPEGVVAMHRMMAGGEPLMGRAPVANDEPLSEAALKKMMADPRYWKKKDPAFIDKVSSGFRRLYGE